MVVFASTLQVGFAGHLELTLVHTVAAGTCSSIGASLPGYDLYCFYGIPEHVNFNKGRAGHRELIPSVWGFCFFFFSSNLCTEVQQTLTELAQSAGHLCTADTTSYIAPCLVAELQQPAHAANHAPVQIPSLLC